MKKSKVTSPATLELSNVLNAANQTAAAKKAFEIIQGLTDAGKPCVALNTDLRLSSDDFKSLMNDIRIAQGYGFMKYHESVGKRLITATKIDPALFLSLCNAYTWAPATPKAAKGKKAGKAATTAPAPGEATNAKTDNNLFAAFNNAPKTDQLAFLANLQSLINGNNK